MAAIASEIKMMMDKKRWSLNMPIICQYLQVIIVIGRCNSKSLLSLPSIDLDLEYSAGIMDIGREFSVKPTQAGW